MTKLICSESAKQRHSLWSLDKKEVGYVDGFSDLSEDHIGRLRVLGLDIESEITCEHIIPLGKSKVFNIGGFLISLTKDIAQKVYIQG